MAKADVFLPTGMRDLLPAQMRARHWVIDTVRGVFARYGFDPLETPALERIETLMGKYGDEGDKLIFKVLKRGEGGKAGEVDSALRYDLTVPLARVVAMNPGLALPFKRYQIEPVWRADRPQKGRFRQFHQGDVDIVGSESPLCEAECLAVVHDALKALGFTDFTIRLNDRRILRAMAAAIGAEDREGAMLTAIDKLDKIGRDGVTAELRERGFSEAQAEGLFAMLEGRAPVPGGEAAEAGLGEIRQMAEALGVAPGHIALDRTLARGLDYYTGPVYETVVTKPAIGSISGGGRYDRLVGMFSGKDIPAVGVSLGLERILTVMEELGMLPDVSAAVDVYVTVWDDATRPAALAAAAAFRAAGLRTELHLGGGKPGKQLQAAERRGARFAAIVGPEEAAAGAVQLKTLASRAQQTLPLAMAVIRAKSERTEP
jgi:histidyl-tRNA synthetase